MYRIRPSALHKPFVPVKQSKIHHNWDEAQSTPSQLRWKPFANYSDEKSDFLDSLNTISGAGDPRVRNGLAIYSYGCHKSMENKCLYNADGDFLIVPQKGTLYLTTEFGKIKVSPLEICLVPQGIKFSVQVAEFSSGYVLEVFDGHFQLPALGPIGANGLANARDFLIPKACYEDKDVNDYRVFCKYQGSIFFASQNHSPFDVVAWRGNYHPSKYDLRLFNVINTVSFDHPVSGEAN